MDEEKDDLTTEETETEEDTGIDAEEAHRVGEFDDLRDKLDTVIAGIESLTKTVSLFVSNGGAVIRDTDDDGETDVVDDDDDGDGVPDVMDLDLSI